MGHICVEVLHQEMCRIWFEGAIPKLLILQGLHFLCTVSCITCESTSFCTSIQNPDLTTGLTVSKPVNTLGVHFPMRIHCERSRIMSIHVKVDESSKCMDFMLSGGTQSGGQGQVGGHISLSEPLGMVLNLLQQK